MANDVDAPPTADLTPGRPIPAATTSWPHAGFFLLFILTVAIDAVDWLDKNCSLIRASRGEKRWPVLRGIFSLFSAHNLSGRVDADLQAMGSDCQ